MLILSQGSIDATVFTLADVLNTFLQLSLNDGPDLPSPMYVTLSTRTRFSTRMQALGEAVAAGKGLSQVDVYSSFEEYESKQVLNDDQSSDVGETEDPSVDYVAVQEDDIAQQQEDPFDEVTTHKDALTTADTDNTNEEHILADDTPAGGVDEHETVNPPEDPDTSNASAVEDAVDVPDPLTNDLEEVEEVNLLDDDGAPPSLEAAQPNSSTHDDGILDLEEEHEDDQDDLEEIPAVPEEVDNENHVRVDSHADGLSDLEDDFDDNLDGDDTAKDTEDHIETTDDLVPTPDPALQTSKRSRPDDEDNVNTPAKKQQLASHHAQSHSETTTET